uniref:Microcephalin n=1 Tax=Phallusia mammillata TaxID=59560 RepID=A0A6F9DJU4_9ASCI|nr:microcephalin [Phallusia mammillata]
MELNNGKIPKPLRLLENNGSAFNSAVSTPNSPLTPLAHRFHVDCDSPSPFIQSIPESNILSDCVVFCDVWSRNGTDNASSLYNRILDRMGAIVTKKFTKFDPITHFVFKSGHKHYVEKAQKRGIKIVSCVWVERCRVTQTKVDEAEFLVDVTNYKPPKKFREMQPLYPEEEKERWEKKEKRRMKREEKLEAKKVQFISPLVLPNSEGFGQQHNVLAQDTPYIYNSPFQFVRPNFVSETPDDYIQKKIQRMKEGRPIFSPPSSPCSSISSLASHPNKTGERSRTSLSQESIGNITHDSPTRCLSFSDNEGSKTPGKKTPQEVMNSQKSDMELTCINLKGSQKSDMELTCMNLKGQNATSSDKSGSTHYNDSSSIKLHLSGCSSVTTNLSSSSLLLPHDERSQMQGSSLHLKLEESDAPDSTVSSYHPEENRKLTSSLHRKSHESNKNDLTNYSSHHGDDRMQESSSSLCLRLEGSNASDLTRSCHQDQDSCSSLHLKLDETDPINSTSSSSLHLQMEDSKSSGRSSLDVVESSQEHSVAPQLQAELEMKKCIGKTKVKRRFLCDEDILKPASILMSPLQRKPTPRRSSRRSSIIATGSISAASSGRRRKSVIRRIDMETPSESDSSAILPPVGASTVKSFAARERYFAPPVEETSSGEEENTRRASSRKSMSTSYDENENVKSGRRKIVSRSVRKRIRDAASTSSSSSSGERKSRTQPSSSAQRSSNVDPPSKSQPSSKRRTQQPLTNVTNGMNPRRSTDEFKTAMLPKKRRRKDVIVLTSLHRDERMQIEKIIKKLGRFRVHQSVSDDRASHVICGAARRTVNVLRAISRGLWLLSKQWVFNSEQAGHWLDEVDYEAVQYFPVARETRLQRHCATNTALPWSSTLFSPLEGRIFVSSTTQPPADDLRELLTLCGGHVTTSPRRAVVRVGPLSTSHCLTSVKETWILDSISENCLKPTEAYLIT